MGHVCFELWIIFLLRFSESDFDQLDVFKHLLN